MELSSLGELRTGYQLRGAVRPQEDGSHTIIQLGDVGDDGVRGERLIRMTLDRVRARDLIAHGDLLLRSRGASYRAALVVDCPSPTVATTPLYVFRLTDNRVSPEYLVWFINREVTQGALAGAAHGTVIPTVGIEAFATLKIIIPPLEKQHEIVQIDALLRTERTLSLQVLEKRERLARTYMERIIEFYQEEGQA